VAANVPFLPLCGGYCPTAVTASMVLYSTRQTSWCMAMSDVKAAAVVSRCCGG